MTKRRRTRLFLSFTAAIPLLAAPLALTGPVQASSPEVAVAGDLDSALGCSGDWVTDCAASDLALRPDGMYSATFDLPAGSYQFKIAVGGSWDVNYGAGGVAGGDNISFTAPGGPVSFYFDPNSHWATTDAISPVSSLVGDFQTQLGCAADNAPDCLSGWLEDPAGSGTLSFDTTSITPGTYHAQVAENLGAGGLFGAGGTAGGAPIAFTAEAGKQLQFRYTAATHTLSVTDVVPPAVGIGQQRAVWVDADTIAWEPSLSGSVDPSTSTWRLYTSPTGGIAQTDSGVAGGTASALTYDPAGLSATELARFPELKGYLALHVNGLNRPAIEKALQGEVEVAQFTGDGVLDALTGTQVPGVLDDLYAAQAQKRTLGVSWQGGIPRFALWAPTAQDVTLIHYDAAGAAHSVPAARQPDGSWTVLGAKDWKNTDYLYQVRVYEPGQDKVVTNTVTDPYSVGLTVDSTRSVAIDLSDPALAPAQWANTPAPTIADPAQRTIYELSVRDFSASDTTVPASLRGTYDAFAVNGDGTKHLKALAAAGLNTVHLQPTFDFASVEEDRSKQTTPACDLASYPADSTQQQACVEAQASTDAYNWGYDPYHFLAPEGSYAVSPDGGSRTTEFRTMVGALHADGLQVVLDEVFNHTSASGNAPDSVLDAVVPGYYQRLDANGAVETSTCCQDTASEHLMMQKLMVDSVVTWAKDYKVDGFRFDLMGFHSVDNMKAIRAALDALTLKKDGVDGKAIYLYGEGWNFGAVQNNADFEQATQGQLDGTGIGTFNDRLRDAVRGGSPVDSSTVQQQGFGSGLASNPSPASGTPDQQSALLAHDSDLVKLGLAGNLADFSFVTADGTVKRGDQIDYNGQPAGYASEPSETINYVDAHDNQTLFDNNAMKLPQSTSMADRVRLQTLSLATATLSQSPSLWLAGTDMLRSKSLDNNSYDSGDWFNAIDWSGQSNGFGKGLPPQASNGSEWGIMQPLLADAALKPSPSDIATASADAQQLLELKKSTRLFSLGSAAQIEQKLSFPASTDPGVIVMRIDDTKGADVDPALAGVLVVFNGTGATTTQTVSGLQGAHLSLSPVQADGSDPVVKATTWDAATGTVTVPARTVAVLAQPQG
ncbi:MAG: pullulanase-type alpha-1,6-glucosidase [Microbacteriaceae bacterium]|nr:pullulanase-type alpha-1,6-glucosidase [Microbacteriaceae bacterium]MCL2796125.1 pullulanase-type alpha-1,6-glucosidase [Microbacteriaceae bacterium]